MFREIGNRFGGYIDFADENAARIESMDVAIKVKGNYCGFVPAGITIKDEESSFLAQTVTFEDIKFIVGKEASVHDGFSLETARSFTKDRRKTQALV